MSIDQTNLYAGLTRASTYQRVDKKTLQKALKPYKLNLRIATGKSDTQLRRLAARTVINRYLSKKQK